MGWCTFSNACHSLILVAVRFLEGKQNIDLRPVWEHLTDDGRLAAVLLPKLGNGTVVVKSTGAIFSRGALFWLVGVGSATASTGKASSTAATSTPAARSGGP